MESKLLEGKDWVNWQDIYSFNRTSMESKRNRMIREQIIALMNRTSMESKPDYTRPETLTEAFNRTSMESKPVARTANAPLLQTF